tara:strand:+ start:472 stop:768 length:297 start_codon:yes stop_codon:yes gene_type:complete
MNEIDLIAKVAMLTDCLKEKRKNSNALSAMIVKRLNVQALLRDLGADVDEQAPIRVAPIRNCESIVAVRFNGSCLRLDIPIPDAVWSEKYGSLVAALG